MKLLLKPDKALSCLVFPFSLLGKFSNKYILILLGCLVSVFFFPTNTKACDETVRFTFEGNKDSGTPQSGGYWGPHKYVYMADDGIKTNLYAIENLSDLSDNASQWVLESVGTTGDANAFPIYYIKNLNTGRYIYRDATMVNNGGTWSYYKINYSSTAPGNDTYKWVIDDTNRRIISYPTYTATFDPDNNYWIHSNNWNLQENGGTYADAPPALICGKVDGSGNAARYSTKYTESINSSVRMGSLDDWNKMTPKEEETLAKWASLTPAEQNTLRTELAAKSITVETLMLATDYCTGTNLNMNGRSAYTGAKYGWKKGTLADGSDAIFLSGYGLSTNTDNKKLSITLSNKTAAPVDEYYFFVTETNCGITKTSASTKITIRPNEYQLRTPGAKCVGDVLANSDLLQGGDTAFPTGGDLQMENSSNVYTSITLPLTLDASHDGKKIKYVVTNGCGTATPITLSVNAGTPISLTQPPLCEGVALITELEANNSVPTGGAWQIKDEGGNYVNLSTSYTVQLSDNGKDVWYDIPSWCGTIQPVTLTVHPDVSFSVQQPAICVGTNLLTELTKNNPTASGGKWWREDENYDYVDVTSSYTVQASDNGKAVQYDIENNCGTISSATLDIRQPLDKIILTEKDGKSEVSFGEEVTVLASRNDIPLIWNLNNEEVNNPQWPMNIYQTLVATVTGYDNICPMVTSDPLTITVSTVPNSISQGGQNPANSLFMAGVDLKMYIFNRYGVTVYSGTGGWDGTYDGKAVDPENYYYVIELPNGDKQKGVVRVVKEDN